MTPLQQSNIRRFLKKIPNNARDNIEINKLPNGGVAVKATSFGKVSGSRAVYEKQIDAEGNTVQFTKTTIDPKGSIVHVKDKIRGQVWTPKNIQK